MKYLMTGDVVHTTVNQLKDHCFMYIYVIASGTMDSATAKHVAGAITIYVIA